MATIALVLGAGGVTGGAFHAGVLAALHDELGWDARRADLVVGTSAGSATGAALRAGLAATDLAARARGESLSDEGRALLHAAGVPPGPPPAPGRPRPRVGPPAAPGILVGALRNPLRVRPMSVLAGLLPAGTVPTDGIQAGIDALHPGGWPAAPFWACAVRLRDGALVVFGRGGSPAVGVGTAVAASCAIPGWFEPVEAAGERYIDGGTHSLTNLDEVVAVQPDLVVVSAPMARTALRAQLRLELQRLQRRGIRAVAFRPTPDDERAMGLNAMDPTRRSAVVNAVRESTRRRIGTLGDGVALLTA